MKKLIKILKYKVSLGIALFPLFASAQTLPPESEPFAPATNNYGLEKAAQGTGVIRDRPTDIVAVLINFILGFLGMIFTFLIILGGFKWMTSAGNKEKVQEARNLIKNATIGLALVLVSYALARFIIGAFKKTSAGAMCTPGVDPGCYGPPAP
jgi:hypothetical protein